MTNGLRLSEMLMTRPAWRGSLAMACAQQFTLVAPEESFVGGSVKCCNPRKDAWKVHFSRIAIASRSFRIEVTVTFPSFWWKIHEVCLRKIQASQLSQASIAMGIVEELPSKIWIWVLQRRRPLLLQHLRQVHPDSIFNVGVSENRKFPSKGGGNSFDGKNDPKNQANASGELDASGCQGPASGSSIIFFQDVSTNGVY